MFKLLFLTQAVIYLLIMPALREFLEPAYDAPLLAGAIAVTALSIGYSLRKFLGKNLHASTPPKRHIAPRAYLAPGIVILVLAYIYVSLSHGLTNRRLGSEYMADLYASLPFLDLAILRVYELIFIPIILLYGFAGRRSSPTEKIIVGLALLISLPFMGIIDSRGRLLVYAIYLLAFMPAERFFKSIATNARLYAAAAVAGGAFVYASYLRATRYASFSDYLLYEVYRRLDGLNVVSDLRFYGFIEPLGSFDLRMFDPLISKIPFLEASQVAKASGRTSTKQFYLQDLLGSTRLDDANSMIADPLYFAGFLGVLISFFLLGVMIAKFDRTAAAGRTFSSRITAASAMAFVTTFGMIEVDMVAALMNFVQSWIIFVLFVLFTCRIDPICAVQPVAPFYPRRGERFKAQPQATR